MPAICDRWQLKSLQITQNLNQQEFYSTQYADLGLPLHQQLALGRARSGAPDIAQGSRHKAELEVLPNQGSSDLRCSNLTATGYIHRLQLFTHSRIGENFRQAIVSFP
ncbi:MAG: hypothetical protein AAF827_07995 [Cyanobacteria bacterium P01_D01_bin.6]